MKHMSKTMTTLTRLRHHYEEEQEQEEALELKQEQQKQHEEENEEMRDDLENRGYTPIPFNSKRSIDVVEFHPEELNDISPLKPEEADELQLADILQGDDLSFLEETNTDSDAKVPSVPEPKSMTTHRIPSDLLVIYNNIGNKRRRLSSMDEYAW